jgi:hypothetical protein
MRSADRRLAKEPIASLLVAEDHKLFPQKIYRLERPVSAQFVDQSRRLPITPQHLPGRLIVANAGDAIILFRAKHYDLQFLSKTPAFMGSFVTNASPGKAGEAPGKQFVIHSFAALIPKRR